MHEQPTNASAWKLKEVAGLKKVEGMFDSDFGPGIHALNFGFECASDGLENRRTNMNKCVQKPVRIMTNSKCLADELNLKYIDRQAQRTEGTKAVKKLGSISGSIGYDCYSFKSSMYKSESKELEMKQRNSTPILMLQAGTTISNNPLVDQWHEAEVAAGDRLEAWDDLTGLSLDPKGVLNAKNARTIK